MESSWLCLVTDNSGKHLLKSVSRSFYLTLRLLPGPMRGAASLAYLLARTSDTLADSVAAPIDSRQQQLERFRECVAGKLDFSGWPAMILDAVSNSREHRLLESSPEILGCLQKLPVTEAILVREVLEIIISGQTLDLENFAQASRQTPVALCDDYALEDYAWRVAGCVGAFWTKLGFLTLGDRFSKSSEEEMMERGIAYGKGLQLVNILRDVASDFAVGRCYLPVQDPKDCGELLACHGRWLVRTGQWLTEGERYAEQLTLRRLRASTILPALLAKKTLSALHEKSWEDLQERIKIPRSAVYCSLFQALIQKT